MTPPAERRESRRAVNARKRISRRPSRLGVPAGTTAKPDRVREPDAAAIERSVEAMLAEIAAYVPGARLLLCETDGDKVTVMVEIEGAAHYLPAYAGNLDIMTSAALRVAERIAALQEVGS